MSNQQTSDIPWYAIQSNLVEVAAWAVDVHALDSPEAVVGFFEKPHNYPELYTQYLEHAEDEA